MPDAANQPQPTYIVESTITTDYPMVEPIFDQWNNIQRYRRLAPEFGFIIVAWNPDRPDVVQEFHWNTADERRADREAVGRIIERQATEREKRDGQRQHEVEVVA